VDDAVHNHDLWNDHTYSELSYWDAVSLDS
jgi:hypothetical protein